MRGEMQRFGWLGEGYAWMPGSLVEITSYSVRSKSWRRARAGLKIKFKSTATNSRPAKTVARIKPYRGEPKASLMAPIASGPRAAAPQVKKRITPATAPCSVFLKQLMPLELMVGYMTDMKSPENGSRNTAAP